MSEHDFVLEKLAPSGAWTRKMFGCTAVYVGDRIVFAFYDRDGSPQDRGIWFATTIEHHESLRQEFPGLRSIALFGPGVTGWQVLPATQPDFEELALRACELVLAGDPRIGKVPKRKEAARSPVGQKRKRGKSPLVRAR